MKKRVLVTGGAGFIGSHIVEALLSHGERVNVLDNFSTGFRRNLKPYRGDIHLIKGDIRDRRAVRKAMEAVSHVFHEAAIRNVAKSVEDPFLCHDVDATGTLILLEEALRRRVERFIYASSSAVYGDVRKFPQRETDPLRPVSPYGSAKLAGEHYCINFFSSHGLPAVCLRYFNVYGPRQNPESKYSSVIPAFIDKLVRGKVAVVDGTGRQSRDFVYVGDVAEANLKAAFGDKRSLGKVINIATGRAYSVLDVLKAVARAAGLKPKMRFGPPRPGDAAKTLGDISQARKCLGWRPDVGFEEGVMKTVHWFLTKRGGFPRASS